jgi:hypothetical protein
MTTNFEWLSANEPKFDPEADTEIDTVTKPFETATLNAPGAYPVSYFMRPTDGFKVGPIIVGSFAYKRFVDHKWIEVQS